MLFTSRDYVLSGVHLRSFLHCEGKGAGPEPLAIEDKCHKVESTCAKKIEKMKTRFTYDGEKVDVKKSETFKKGGRVLPRTIKRKIMY